MKKILFAVCLMTLGFAGFSQDETASDTTYWKKGGLASLTFTQVSLSDNWAAGGQNSVSFNGFFTTYADYRKDRIVWKNVVEAGYGLISQNKDDFEKTDDRLNLITDFGYKITEKLSWSSVLDFRTQFVKGVVETDEGDSTISKFMNPGYLIIATGLSWNPDASFSLSYSPLGGKFTFVTNQKLADEGAYGVDAGKHARAELGSFLKMSYNKEVVENVSFESRLELFANYLENFGNVDVNWQNLLVMKVNDFLTVNWQTQLIYDDDIKFDRVNDNGDVIGSGPATQFKSVFGVGLAYNFGQTR